MSEPLKRYSSDETYREIIRGHYNEDWFKATDVEQREKKLYVMAEQIFVMAADGNKIEDISRSMMVILAAHETKEQLATMMPITEHNHIVAETITSLDTERTEFEERIAALAAEADAHARLAVDVSQELSAVLGIFSDQGEPLPTLEQCRERWDGLKQQLTAMTTERNAQLMEHEETANVLSDRLTASESRMCRLEEELAEAKCGEALCGHDHTTQYWELRENKARGEVTDLRAQLTAMEDFIGLKFDEDAQCYVSGKLPYLSAGRTKTEACIAAVDALRMVASVLEEKLTAMTAERNEVKEFHSQFFERHVSREKYIAEIVFQHIRHGDDKHQEWLRQALVDVLCKDNTKACQTFDQLYDQLTASEARMKELEHQHRDLVLRNQLLRNRPDLPISRVQGYDEVMLKIDTLTAQLTAMTAERDEWKKRYEETVQWQMQGYTKGKQKSVCDHSLFSENLHRAVYTNPNSCLVCRTCGKEIV